MASITDRQLGVALALMSTVFNGGSLVLKRKSLLASGEKQLPTLRSLCLAGRRAALSGCQERLPVEWTADCHTRRCDGARGRARHRRRQGRNVVCLLEQPVVVGRNGHEYACRSGAPPVATRLVAASVLTACGRHRATCSHRSRGSVACQWVLGRLPTLWRTCLRRQRWSPPWEPSAS